MRSARSPRAVNTMIGTPSARALSFGDQGQAIAIGQPAIEQHGGMDVGRNGLLRLGTAS